MSCPFNYLLSKWKSYCKDFAVHISQTWKGTIKFKCGSSMWKGKFCSNKNGGMISTFKVGYLPWHAINKLRFLFNTILRCNNEKVESIQIFLSIFVFILYFITISYSLTLSYLLFSLSCLQLYELSDDTKRKDFLDDLFAFMQKRGKNELFTL